MFNPDTSISEFVPFSSHVSPSVIKTRDGDYLLSVRRGVPTLRPIGP